MSYSDFMDVLGKLHKLTPAQRRAVAEVLAEPEEVQRPAEASEPVGKPKKNRKEYTNADMSAIDFAVGIWNQMSDEARTLCVHDIARRLGRTNKAIRYQITSRLK
jgi:delta 1-pyrroline-5-carboxylate dehydrogenase